MQEKYHAFNVLIFPLRQRWYFNFIKLKPMYHEPRLLQRRIKPSEEHYSTTALRQWQEMKNNCFQTHGRRVCPAFPQSMNVYERIFSV